MPRKALSSMTESSITWTAGRYRSSSFQIQNRYCRRAHHTVNTTWLASSQRVYGYRLAQGTECNTPLSSTCLTKVEYKDWNCEGSYLCYYLIVSYRRDLLIWIM